MRVMYLAVCIALAGCGTTVSRTEIPESLLNECTRPKVDASTNAGLVKGLIEYDAVLQSCNNDKAAIRQHLKD